MLSGRKQFVGGMSGALAIALALVGGAGACGGGGGGGGTSPIGGGGAGGGGNLSQRPAAAVPLYDEARVHELALTMSADDWQSIIDDSRGDEWRHASVTYDGVVVDDVGVRPAGESSRFAGNQKMSIRIKFDAFDGHGKFGGYGDVNVKGEYDDGSMMRERLAFFVFGSVHAGAQGGAHDADGQRRRARSVHAARGLGRDVDLGALLTAGRSALPDPGAGLPCRSLRVRQRRSRQLRSAAVGSPYQEDRRGRRGRRRRS